MRSFLPKGVKTETTSTVYEKSNTIFTTILLALAYSVFSPLAHAVVPPPDGSYPGFNTAEGQKSLFSLTFHYKSDIEQIPQFGAEEVAKVNPALVLPDKEGKPYTVRYEAVNAMLLNEFLKEHQK